MKICLNQLTCNFLATVFVINEIKRMTINKLQLFFAVLIFACTVNAQTYSGKVIDATTKETLPFVSIGIPGKGVGTIAQLDGSFAITISDDFNNDTIRFSMIGYKPQLLAVSTFKTQAAQTPVTISLQADEKQLEAVVIRPRNMKNAMLGNEYNSPSISAGFTTDDLGSELGTVMKVKDGKEYYLLSCGINFAKVNYDSIIFRVNIYALENGLPGQLLHQLPIYVTVYRDQKSAEIDLKQYNIKVDDDFVLSLEWLQDLPDKTKAVMFCAGFFGNKIVYRQTAQDIWRDFPVGIGMWCAAEYEK